MYVMDILIVNISVNEYWQCRVDMQKKHHGGIEKRFN